MFKKTGPPEEVIRFSVTVHPLKILELRPAAPGPGPWRAGPPKPLRCPQAQPLHRAGRSLLWDLFHVGSGNKQIICVLLLPGQDHTAVEPGDPVLLCVLFGITSSLTGACEVLRCQILRPSLEVLWSSAGVPCNPQDRVSAAHSALTQACVWGKRGFLKPSNSIFHWASSSVLFLGKDIRAHRIQAAAKKRNRFLFRLSGKPHFQRQPGFSPTQCPNPTQPGM